jgi:hypothetical protein
MNEERLLHQQVASSVGHPPGFGEDSAVWLRRERLSRGRHEFKAMLRSEDLSKGSRGESEIPSVPHREDSSES